MTQNPKSSTLNPKPKRRIISGSLGLYDSNVILVKVILIVALRITVAVIKIRKNDMWALTWGLGPTRPDDVSSLDTFAYALRQP